MNCLEFLEANETVRYLASRIAKLQSGISPHPRLRLKVSLSPNGPLPSVGLLTAGVVCTLSLPGITTASPTHAFEKGNAKGTGGKAQTSRLQAPELGACFPH